MRTYLARHDAHRELCDLIVDARRRADIRWRLDAALASQNSMPTGR